MRARKADGSTPWTVRQETAVIVRSRQSFASASKDQKDSYGFVYPFFLAFPRPSYEILCRAMLSI